MPSRYSPPDFPPSLTNPPHHFQSLPLIIAASLTLTVALLLLITILFYRKLYRNPSDLFTKSPHHYQCRRFSYTQLTRATNSFSETSKLGNGGFGSVYKADFPNGDSFAVKVMDTSGECLQGEREFHNELSLSTRLIGSPNIVSLFGFSEENRGKKKLVLVYELMVNRSLQDSLLDRRCVELMDWNKRFEIVIDIAKGIEFLHHSCVPCVIHGDIKPSNILLDSDFKAKIGDFGLARIKSEEGEKQTDVIEDNGSIQEETDSVITVFEKANVVDLSPENCGVSVLTETEVSPESCLDKMSVESSKQKVGSKRDWWWKQDHQVRSESGVVKDYVMEWIGSEIKKERPKEWIKNGDVSSSSPISKKKKKKRKPREWWKEEFCEELTRKKKKKKKKSIDSWFRKDEKEEDTSSIHKPTKRKKRNSIDWWINEPNSQDSGLWCDVNVQNSNGVSSTPSMRGTVCYIAPECGGGGLLSEKSDVYSFGVLLLVLISGRRPLQVTASPMSEFERANLISWAKQLACNGKLLELVDKSIHSLEKEQAVLCITIALLCLQRSPVKRPTMEEIVQMLEGVAEPPCLPFEFSPSPPVESPFQTRKKGR